MSLKRVITLTAFSALRCGHRSQQSYALVCRSSSVVAPGLSISLGAENHNGHASMDDELADFTTPVALIVQSDRTAC
jgi:hypothetical protein